MAHKVPNHIDQEIEQTLNSLEGMSQMRMPEGLAGRILEQAALDSRVPSESASPWYDHWMMRAAAVAILAVSVFNFSQTFTGDAGLSAEPQSQDDVYVLGWTGY